MIGFTRPQLGWNEASKSDSAPTWYCVSPSGSTADEPAAHQQVRRRTLAAVALGAGRPPL